MVNVVRFLMLNPNDGRYLLKSENINLSIIPNNGEYIKIEDREFQVISRQLTITGGKKYEVSSDSSYIWTIALYPSTPFSEVEIEELKSAGWNLY